MVPRRNCRKRSSGNDCSLKFSQASREHGFSMQAWYSYRSIFGHRATTCFSAQEARRVRLCDLLLCDQERAEHPHPHLSPAETEWRHDAAACLARAAVLAQECHLGGMTDKTVAYGDSSLQEYCGCRVACPSGASQEFSETIEWKRLFSLVQSSLVRGWVFHASVVRLPLDLLTTVFSSSV